MTKPIFKRKCVIEDECYLFMPEIKNIELLPEPRNGRVTL